MVNDDWLWLIMIDGGKTMPWSMYLGMVYITYTNDDLGDGCDIVLPHIIWIGNLVEYSWDLKRILILMGV